MKKIFYPSLLIMAVSVTACHKDNNSTPTDPNTGVTFAVQGDQVARPGLNIVFISSAEHDKFNQTEPSQMASIFGTEIKNKLLALNPNYTTNKIGLTADQFAGALSTDVLNVSLTGPTTFYDGTHVLTGRNLADDVIDDNFTLIFGGIDGTSNPGLTSDHVDKNDKDFSNSFPYEASPW
ncbi:MAG: DUF4331 family protein [Arachidicoccus sp.]|nr:DUF4331 family protein [Arachidicoccus sp.]